MSSAQAPGSSFRARLDALAAWPAIGAASRGPRRPGLAALVRLNREVARAALLQDPDQDPTAFATGPAIEMRSVRRFHAAWARISVEERVVRALMNPPPNPGPLNSEMLLLRALETMRALSPAYLLRFMSQVDAALWLDARPAKAEGRPSAGRRRGRRREDQPAAIRGTSTTSASDGSGRSKAS